MSMRGSPPVVIDTAGAAALPDAERLQRWMSAQWVFISSAMADTMDERAATAAAVQASGAQAVWFEEFGGRDADPAAAYLSEVDRCTIYLAILNARYGKQHATGYSATHAEYDRATERGLRRSIWVAQNAPDRDGHLQRFIDDLRLFNITGSFSSADDLARRVTDRLQAIAAEQLSPWVKLGANIFRADRITDAGATITIDAHPADHIVRAVEHARDQQFGDHQLTFTYGDRTVTGRLAGVSRTVEATGRSGIAVALDRCQPVRANSMRMSINALGPDEIVEHRLRHMLFAESLPDPLDGFGSFGAEATGPHPDALATAFGLPEEIVRPITRLLLVEGLIGSGNAHRITAFELGARNGDRRRLELGWEEPHIYENVTPGTRHIEGIWRKRPDQPGGRG
jgi:Domain of unknown function (DUF4062)